MINKVVTGIAAELPEAEKLLAKVETELVRASLKTENDIIEHVSDADAVIVGPIEPYTKKAIRAMTKCKIISRMGIGCDNVDVEEATRQGIPVAIVVDASIHEVSDYAMACILALSRKLFPLTQAVRAGAWAGSKEIMAVRGNICRLNQQAVGLVGMGRIGSLVISKARAFGLRVLVYDPYVPSEVVLKKGAEPVDFEYLLKESDFISLHAPLTPDTELILGLQEFKKMKPTAYIINASRGRLIDEHALYQAITDGEIAGACLDVMDPEPPNPENPLLNLEQVMVTGHCAYFSESSIRELQQRAAEAVVLALQNQWPPTLANPDVKKQPNRRIGLGSGKSSKDSCLLYSLRNRCH